MAANMIRKLFATTLTAASLVLAGLGAVAATTDDKGPDYRQFAAETSLAGSFLAAQAAASVNDDVAAVAFYERSLALDPDNPELKQMLFLALSTNGRIEDAVKIARESLLDRDGFGFARVVVAVDAMKRKSFTRVGEIIGEASQADLDGLVDELLVAWSKFGAGDSKGAIEMARKYDGPDWVGVVRNYHAGLMAAASGNDAQAIEYFSDATANQAVAAILSETYLRALEGLARAQLRSGDTAGAKETLDVGLELISSHPPFVALAASLNSDKPLMPLITTAQQGAAEIFYNVGAAISRQNGAPFAQSYLQLANYLYPKADFIAMSLAGLFEKQKDYERANAFYAQIDAKSPYYRRSRIEYALNLNDLERLDESRKMLRDLLAEDGSDLLPYLTLGGVLSQHKEYEEAAGVYDQAVANIGEPQTQQWNLFYRRGIAYERIKQWDKAEPNFRKALELSPDQADVLNYLGYSWIDMGINLDEGMDLIRKAVELDPRSGFIVDSLGWAYFKIGEYEKAVEQLERAVEIMPQDPVINDHLGDAYWQVGRRLEATFQWNHALSFEPELPDKVKIRLKLKNGLETKRDNTVSSE
jgi:tetratricopeptide (TPR) repeat protein